MASESSVTDSLVIFNKFSEELFQEFIKIIFEFLIQPRGLSKVLVDLEAFSGCIGVSKVSMKNIIAPLVQFLQNCVKQKLSPEILMSRLQEQGLCVEKSSIVVNHWQVNYAALYTSKIAQIIMINQLIDMEWRFGVTAATSNSNQCGHSFLQLKLVIDKGNQATENVYMELSLPEFYSFLHEMEKAKANIELLC